MVFIKYTDEEKEERRQNEILRKDEVEERKRIKFEKKQERLSLELVRKEEVAQRKLEREEKKKEKQALKDEKEKERNLKKAIRITNKWWVPMRKAKALLKKLKEKKAKEDFKKETKATRLIKKFLKNRAKCFPIVLKRFVAKQKRKIELEAKKIEREAKKNQIKEEENVTVETEARVAPETSEFLMKQSKPELHNICESKQIKGFKNMNKTQLTEAIMKSIVLPAAS